LRRAVAARTIKRRSASRSYDGLSKLDLAYAVLQRMRLAGRALAPSLGALLSVSRKRNTVWAHSSAKSVNTLVRRSRVLRRVRGSRMRG
jgi:hypothetical protein